MPLAVLIHILNFESFFFFLTSCFAVLICKGIGYYFFFLLLEILSIVRAPMLLDLCQLSYKADTLTMFPPEYSGNSGLSSPSGVVTGGVGMLIIAVVT